MFKGFPLLYDFVTSNLDRNQKYCLRFSDGPYSIESNLSHNE